VDDRKSTSGGAFFIGSSLVSWFGKKQSSIALSIAEVEYVAAASCCTQLLWMMQILQDFQITCTPPISILCDKISAISISKNPFMHSKTKHIPIKYHFLQEQVLEQKVKLDYVPSKEQGVDILTKPLPRETFEYLKQKLGVVDASSYHSNLSISEKSGCTRVSWGGYAYICWFMWIQSCICWFEDNSGPGSG